MALPMYSVTPEFRQTIGAFFQVWASVEFTVDFAIGKFLKIPHEETHLVTAGLAFGRRALLLKDILKRSDHPSKHKALAALKPIQEEKLRNILAHSYILSDEESVTFVERIPHGGFSAKPHPFTRDIVVRIWCRRVIRQDRSAAFASTEDRKGAFILAPFVLVRGRAAEIVPRAFFGRGTNYAGC